jgi:7-carboxy-7-deazaguanine synthase
MKGLAAGQIGGMAVPLSPPIEIVDGDQDAQRPVRGVTDGMATLMQRINISEIFYSIQGESTYAGLPCVFVRTAGCNLRCKYCDTEYAREGGDAMEIKDILDKVASFGVKLVEVTGGEPLHQDNVPGLVSGLLDAGYEVLVETNGSYSISALDGRAVRIVDIKCPGSGMSDKVDWVGLAGLTAKDQVKFVISGRDDYLWARNVLGSRDFAGAEVLFSPVRGTMEPSKLAGWILRDRLPVRLQLQIHKYIWGDDVRGV